MSEGPKSNAVSVANDAPQSKVPTKVSTTATISNNTSHEKGKDTEMLDTLSQDKHIQSVCWDVENAGVGKGTVNEERPTTVNTTLDRSAGAVPQDSTDRASPTSVVVDSEPATSKSQVEKMGLQNNQGTSTDNNGKAHEEKIQALEAQLGQAEAQRSRMAEKLKKRKQLLIEAEQNRVTMESRLAEAKEQIAELQNENADIRSGLQSVVAVRDDLKNKLRVKQEILKEARMEKEDVERKLKRSEQQRALEVELLENYRKLATHTGFFKWGKTIRLLEAELATATAASEQDDE